MCSNIFCCLVTLQYFMMDKFLWISPYCLYPHSRVISATIVLVKQSHNLGKKHAVVVMTGREIFCCAMPIKLHSRNLQLYHLLIPSNYLQKYTLSRYRCLIWSLFTICRLIYLFTIVICNYKILSSDILELRSFISWKNNCVIIE